MLPPCRRTVAGLWQERGTIYAKSLHNRLRNRCGAVMSYTLGEAARATGKAKSTISRDIKSGKISATRNPDGGWTIDPAELHRVHPSRMQSNGSGNGGATVQSNDTQPVAATAATPFEQREIELLRAHMAEKDARIADKDAVIEDLRRRLDQATALLTDQREKAATPASAWGRFLAWRRGR